MRPSRLLVVLTFAAALAGCAHAPAPPAEAVAAGPADIDSIVYGRLGALFAPAPPPGPMPVAVPVPPPVAVPAPLPMAVAVPPPPPPVVPVASVMPELVPPDEPYTLDAGDRLRITVYGQEGLTNSYIVDASGRITMPFIGAVVARGCSTTQLSRIIADRLRRGYIREPHVAIEVEAYRPFFILGEVLVPGQYPYVPNMTVETAVAIAGGYTPRAYRWNAEVSRSAGGLTARQKVPTIAPVRPGDTITVTERWF
jgi:polysaccharide export outer membrane protein